LHYRAEIDGLRALAVVPVILFHAEFEIFSGGFVGVDVFLVISGYLITTILINDIENNRFSIVGFYERRARRILPALFFVILVSIPIAWLWMIPSQMKDFSQSLVAVSLFVSNISFWLESSYFGATAKEMPMLHTWSLAVEEQYYVFFPIFLVLAWRFGKHSVFWMIVLFAAISLALSEWGWRNTETANFYLTPTRVWELFSGSIAAFVVHKRGVRANNILSSLGLAAIIFAIFIYDENTPSPSVYTLIPVIGAVLLVMYADKKTIAARILSTKVFVGIGLISYSAYLWHQPLFAFSRIRSTETPGMVLMLFLSVTTFGVAVLCWKFIEQPFRNKENFSRLSIFSLSTVMLIGTVFFGILGYAQNGFENRVPNLVKEIEIAGVDAKLSCTKTQFHKCVIGSDTANTSVALLGDSHATRYGSGLSDVIQDVNLSIAVYSRIWCAPLLEWKATVGFNGNSCYPYMTKALLNIAEDNSIKTVILAAEWSNYTNGYRFDSTLTTYSYADNENFEIGNNATQFNEAFLQTINRLVAADKKIIIVEPVPEYEYNVPIALAKSVLFKGVSQSKPLTIDEYRTWNFDFFSSLEKVSSDAVTKFEVKKKFCDDTNCLPYDSKGLPLYSDSNHLSSLGLQKVSGDILYEVTNLLKDISYETEISEKTSMMLKQKIMY